MKASRTTTVDGRASYKTIGGTKTQAVYQRVGGQYVKGPDGKPIVIGYRVIRYGWVSVAGKMQKTSPVSVVVTKHPNDMTASEQKALDRDLSELLEHSKSALELIRNATDKVRDAMESSGAMDGGEFAKTTGKVLRLLETGSPKDAATKAAMAEFVGVAQETTVSAKTLAEQARLQLDKEIGDLSALEIDIEQMALVKAKDGRLKSLGAACVAYFCDHDNVHAKGDTRRIYASYIRNHLMVPTAKGRTAIGDLAIPDVDKPTLTAFEKSLYRDRDGYRLNHSPTAPQWDCEFVSWLNDAVEIPRKDKRQVKLDPKTAGKIIHFISSVVEWAMAQPKRWGLESYPINTVSKYNLTQKTTATRKTFAPRGSDFWKLVKVAEELNVPYMIPLMALTRLAFRPSESRGLRWIDLTTKDINGVEHDAAVVRGTILNIKGGETWVGEGKSPSAMGDPVIIPKSIMDLLKKHRVKDCDYVCPPAPSVPGAKNASRRTKPFLTKGDYADAWKLIKAKAGLPANCDMYTLKHGMIAELLLAGHSSKSVTLMTRHTTEAMVDTIYGAIQSGDLAAAIDVLNEKSPQG